MLISSWYHDDVNSMISSSSNHQITIISSYYHIRATKKKPEQAKWSQIKPNSTKLTKLSQIKSNQANSSQIKPKSTALPELSRAPPKLPRAPWGALGFPGIPWHPPGLPSLKKVAPLLSVCMSVCYMTNFQFLEAVSFQNPILGTQVIFAMRFADFIL